MHYALRRDPDSKCSQRAEAIGNCPTLVTRGQSTGVTPLYSGIVYSSATYKLTKKVRCYVRLSSSTSRNAKLVSSRVTPGSRDNSF